MSRKKSAPAAALPYLDPSFFERNPKHRAALEEVRASQEIAQLVSSLRAGAKLGVKELARAAGLSTKALEKLESGTNPRVALAQLRQVAAALGKKVEVTLVTAGRARAGKAKPDHGARPRQL